jgi:hypothetical protein
MIYICCCSNLKKSFLLFFLIVTAAVNGIPFRGSMLRKLQKVDKVTLPPVPPPPPKTPHSTLNPTSHPTRSPAISTTFPTQSPTKNPTSLYPTQTPTLQLSTKTSFPSVSLEDEGHKQNVGSNDDAPTTKAANAGLIVGSVAGFLGMIGLLVLFTKCKRKRSSPTPSSPLQCLFDDASDDFSLGSTENKNNLSEETDDSSPPSSPTAVTNAGFSSSKPLTMIQETLKGNGVGMEVVKAD